MSTHQIRQRITVPAIAACKNERKIVSLTAYSKPIAELIDEHVDLIIVGDSTAMVAYGRPTTLDLTLQQMIAHARAVVDATRHACVVVDMPFGTYQESPELAYRHCARLIAQSGADAVKLEGGSALAPTVRFLVERGIPVMAHVGLMPQYVHTMGGFKAQGMSPAAAERIGADARAHVEAGAFSLLLEGLAEPLARAITEREPVPTIGIGASPSCDGQVLVTEDILRLSGDHPPRFAKQYADAAALISQAAAAFAADVRGGAFPELKHCFGVDTAHARQV
ncbi:3-methyl-2-oxobutanoate hydroxymethyltransferase [Burkholderia territorii]|uniref:3-methyl-2-oxobutanoate hydroxymethyltransferase n=1 Tax=Burkholderia territorii TaxID=1503055 RepID=UPI00075AA834|nr:3-methyl-2-oxobutanoate hydroxymethyltransferase [Burkholderia territorii]KVL44152.1 3-methyl-2-oxobutanoate hydroxymethyltransferase [Burkholderia territorii]